MFCQPPRLVTNGLRTLINNKLLKPLVTNAAWLRGARATPVWGEENRTSPSRWGVGRAPHWIIVSLLTLSLGHGLYWHYPGWQVDYMRLLYKIICSRGYLTALVFRAVVALSVANYGSLIQW